MTGNRTDAEDVVQETCLRAFRLIASFTSGNARDCVPHANLHPQVIAPSR
ncbi:MAG: sigma factor [Xanthobacteraceae bacterium]